WCAAGAHGVPDPLRQEAWVIRWDHLRVHPDRRPVRLHRRRDVRKLRNPGKRECVDRDLRAVVGRCRQELLRPGWVVAVLLERLTADRQAAARVIAGQLAEAAEDSLVNGIRID